jgi:hypothetical protein
MELEVIVAFVPPATLGEVYEAANCARNRSTIYVKTGDGVNGPVVASFGSERVAGDLHTGNPPRRREAKPVEATGRQAFLANEAQVSPAERDVEPHVVAAPIFEPPAFQGAN